MDVDKIMKNRQNRRQLMECIMDLMSLQADDLTPKDVEPILNSHRLYRESVGGFDELLKRIVRDIEDKVELTTLLSHAYDVPYTNRGISPDVIRTGKHMPRPPTEEVTTDVDIEVSEIFYKEVTAENPTLVSVATQTPRSMASLW